MFRVTIKEHCLVTFVKWPMKYIKNVVMLLRNLPHMSYDTHPRLIGCKINKKFYAFKFTKPIKRYIETQFILHCRFRELPWKLLLYKVF